MATQDKYGIEALFQEARLGTSQASEIGAGRL